MKIIICSRYSIFDIKGGGGEVTMHEYARGLSTYGHKVTMIVTKPDESKPDYEAIIDFNDGEETVYELMRFKGIGNSLISILPKIIKEVNEIKPDCVIMTSFADATVGFFIEKITGAKVIALTHDEFNVYGYRPPFNIFFVINRKFFAKHIHKVIAVNHNAARAIYRELGYYPDVSYTGFGDNILQFPTKNTPTYSDAGVKTKFLFVGRFFPEKGMDYLADAITILAKTYPNIECKFVGDGGYLEKFREKYKEQIKSGLIITTGYVDDDTLKNIYIEADIFVNPTYANEGIVFTNIEAMKNFALVISTNVGAIPEIIHNGDNGYLVKPKDVSELVSCMKNVLKEDIGVIDRIRLNGLHTASMLTRDKATQRLLLVIE